MKQLPARIRKPLGRAAVRLFGIKQVQKLITSIVLSDQYRTAPFFDMAAFQQAYQVHPWVFACVRAITDNVGRVPLMAYERKVINGKTITEPLPDHPVSRVLRNPNPFTSAFDLHKNTGGYKELSGNAYWFIARGGGGVVQQLINLRPDRVTIVPDRTNFVAGYLYRIGDYTFRFQPRDIIHHKFFNPYDDLYGQSTLQALKLTLMDDTEARAFNFNFYRKGARMDGALSYDQTLQDADYNRIRAEWRAAHEGQNNAHKIAVLEKGAKYETIGVNQKDMDFINARKLNREEISSGFGVPPVLVNSYEHANYNTAKTQVVLFWHQTLIPKLVGERETLTNAMGKMLGPLAAELSKEQEIFIDYDLSRVWALTAERREVMSTDLAAVKDGVVTINEVRERENLAPVAWGDTWWKGSGLVDVEAPPPAPLPEPPPGNGDEPPPEGEPPPEETPPADEEQQAVRGTAWKGFTERATPLERAFEGFVEKMLDAQTTEMLRNLRRLAAGGRSAKAFDGATIELILFNLEEMIRFVAETASPLMFEAIQEGGKAGAALLPFLAGFDPRSEGALSFLEHKRQKFAERVSNTTWKEVKGSLVAGVAEGESIAKLADRIEGTMGARGAKKFEIARTEVIGAMNGGILESFKQGGPSVIGKEWLTAGDEIVRDGENSPGNHARMEGVVVGLNAAFQLDGGPMRFPGDPGGAAEEVINCRCTMLPKLED